MDVRTTRKIDAGTRDADGVHDHHYEYDVLTSTDGSTSLIARSDVDEPGRAAFLTIEEEGVRRRLVRADVTSPLAFEAILHFRRSGKHDIVWLSGAANGYEPVPDD